MPDLLNKCKNRNNRLNAGKSLQKNTESMPKFEHFPMRKNIPVSIDRISDLPSEEECKMLIQFLNSQKEKEKVFQSLLKNDRSNNNFGGRVNPNQERIIPSKKPGKPKPVERVIRLSDQKMTIEILEHI